MRILTVIGLPILAIIAVAIMISSRAEPPKKERVDLDPMVAVFELQTMAADFTVQSQGTVQPRTETVLSAEISGTISHVSPKFVAGGVFAANEVLVRIDPTNYTVAVDQANALLKQRQIEYDGASELRLQGYRAESDLASAAAALASAKADLVRAERNLQRTYIRLPYEGIVRAKEADLGQFVSPGTRLGVVFSTDFAEVRLPLTDQDLAFVNLPNAAAISRTGSAVGPAVRLSAQQKGKTAEWDATIVRTEGVVDETSRVTYAVARVDDPYRLHTSGSVLPVGSFVAATIQGMTAENVIRVPREMLRGSDELVFVDRDERLAIRKIEIVRADADYVYVIGGAVSGERIVATALETPVNGMLVRVKGDDGATGRSPTTAAEEQAD